MGTHVVRGRLLNLALQLGRRGEVDVGLLVLLDVLRLDVRVGNQPGAKRLEARVPDKKIVKIWEMSRSRKTNFCFMDTYQICRYYG